MGNAVLCVTFSQDNKFIIAGCKDWSIKIWHRLNVKE